MLRRCGVMFGATVLGVLLGGAVVEGATVTTDGGGYATGVQGLIVDGQVYDVVFASPATDSFQGLWDPNNDGDYADSTTGQPPTFINNEPLALEAAGAIMTALGSTYQLPYSFPGGAGRADSVVVPFERYQKLNSLYAVKYHYDYYAGTASDYVGNVSAIGVNGLFKNSANQSAFAIFSQVPEPGSAVAMLGMSGLLANFRRR